MEIHYFAAARAARGVAQENIPVTKIKLSELLNELANTQTRATSIGLTLDEVFKRCTFLIDGKAADLNTFITNDSRLDILPPFAGG